MRGSIIKKNGRLYVIYYVGKKQKWEKVQENKHGRQTKSDAQKLLAQRISEVNSGTYREIKKTTFREFAERWLRDYVDDPNHIKASTALGYHQIFNACLLPFFGDHWLSNITADEVQKFVAALSRRGLSPKTIRNYLVPMRTMLRHAARWGYLKVSPMPDVEMPKAIKPEMGFLSPQEIRSFLDHIPEKWHVFFVTAAMTGMRMCELLAMKWSNLDLDGRQFHVKERIYNGVFDTPKSKASVRAVDLPPAVIDALRRHRKSQNERRLSRGAAYSDNDLIFARGIGKPYHKTTHIRKVFTDALTKAECPTVRLHDLRHSYASLLIRQKVSPKYIQKQLGHASIQVTFDVYGHLMNDVDSEVMNRLSEQVFSA